MTFFIPVFINEFFIFRYWITKLRIYLNWLSKKTQLTRHFRFDIVELLELLFSIKREMFENMSRKFSSGSLLNVRRKLKCLRDHSLTYPVKDFAKLQGFCSNYTGPS